MAKLHDGGYLMTGGISDNNSDILLVKTDSLGVIQWQKAYGGQGSDAPTGLALTKDGGSVICGYTSSDSLPLNRALLLKLDLYGNIEWSKSYGRDYEWANAVIQTEDKGYLAVGATGTQSSSMHMWYFKTDSLGNMQWNRKISGYGCCGYGGSLTRVIETTDKNYVLAGSEYCYYCSANAAYVTKIDLNDTVIWVSPFVGGLAVFPSDLIQTHDNGFMVVGTNNNSVGLLKIDSAGGYKWHKRYSWINNSGTSVAETKDRGYIMTSDGYPAKNIFLHKTDSSGNLLWSKAYGDTSKFTSTSQKIFINDDKGYTIGAGLTFTGGPSAFYLLRVDSSGQGYCSEFAVSPTVDAPLGANGGIFYRDTLGGFRSVTLTSYSLTLTDSTLCEHVLSSTTSVAPPASIYPNPFSESTMIYLPRTNEVTTVELLNSMGQRLNVFENVTSGEFVLKRGNLSAGIYLVKVISGKGIVGTQKIIVTD